MKSIDFGKAKYLITEYCYDYQYPQYSSIVCIGCNSKQEVFQYFTDQLNIIANSYLEEDLQRIVDGTEDLDIVLDMLRNGQVITNLGMITGFLDIFAEGDSCAFRITDDEGKVWFSYKC